MILIQNDVENTVCCEHLVSFVHINDGVERHLKKTKNDSTIYAIQKKSRGHLDRNLHCVQSILNWEDIVSCWVGGWGGQF